MAEKQIATSWPSRSTSSLEFLCSRREAESLFRKESSPLVEAIAECLHTASIRQFSRLRRERGPSPHTRRVCQPQQAKRLACHLDTWRERPTDRQPCLHRREDPPWS